MQLMNTLSNYVKISSSAATRAKKHYWNFHLQLIFKSYLKISDT